MRTDIVNPDANKLQYEIREIVAVAEEIDATGQEITWENIGDPIAKGESVPDWIKGYVREAVKNDESYAYSPTRGLEEARQYVADRHNKRSTTTLHPDNILFCNGLGDAIANIYHMLHPDARMIGPDPAYPAHAGGEAAHAGDSPLTYRLDPESGWQIDTDDLEMTLQNNQSIVGILLINPGNPTGAVFTRDTLKAVVELAHKYNCFLLVDSIYDNLRFPTAPDAHITDVLGDVPALILRGLSKDVPWPGARCGWIEFHNIDNDSDFATLCTSLVSAKMREVCSTTLPQMVLPEIYSDERWGSYLQNRSQAYARRADILTDVLSGNQALTVVKPAGAYYASIVIDTDALSADQTLSVKNSASAAVIKPLLSEVALDKRFTYFLLAAEGICVVPLSSGFHSRYHGFRMTLLEPDADTFKSTLQRISSALDDYLLSA